MARTIPRDPAVLKKRKADARRHQATDTSSASQTKRPKRSASNAAAPAAKRDQTHHTDTSAIALRNQQISPLLRLPLELREQIWALAFGHRTVHPLSDRSYGVQGLGKLRYRECYEQYSDAEIYAFAKRGASPDNENRWAAAELYFDIAPDPGLRPDRVNGVHLDCTKKAGKDSEEAERDQPRTGFGVPAVCKQMYHEATPLAWKTTTFAFYESVSFEDFVRTPSVKRHLVEQLSITLDTRGYRNGWQGAITPGAISSFTALQGLNLQIVQWNGGSSLFTGDVATRSAIVPSEWRHVPTLIREFQHVKLRPERTTAWNVNAAYAFCCWQPVADYLEGSENVRKALLTYKPRRLGGRRRREA